MDRREADREAIISALRELEAGVQGLKVELLDEQDYWDAADSGAFRDFIALATLSHTHREALEYVAEDLLEQFGWLVDFRPPQTP